MTTPGHHRGFSLIELMVAMFVLGLLAVGLASLTQMISRTWTSSVSRIEQFREAREAFETISRRLSPATLNTYWDYERSASGDPVRYIRQSELRFVSGPGLAGDAASSPPRPGHAIFFQAPAGYHETPQAGELQNLLNTMGYFIEFNDDASTRPPFVAGAARSRFRLTELAESADQLTVFKYTSGKGADGQAKTTTYTGREWFENPLAGGSTRAVAENIIALILLPRFAQGERSSGGGILEPQALAPDYTYDSTVSGADPELDSKNQLPPVVQVIMVAIDETSAARMGDDGSARLLTKLGGLFTAASNLDQDLYLEAGGQQSLEAYLIENKINYRIFSSTVSLKSAKWSRE
ncbi:MAG: Verru_Chthon cassette protein C [Terrimicrobiaceae bacterium]